MERLAPRPASSGPVGGNAIIQPKQEFVQNQPDSSMDNSEQLQMQPAENSVIRMETEQSPDIQMNPLETAQAPAKKNACEGHTSKVRPHKHKVRSGDTLGGLANFYGVKKADIKKVNGLKDDTIQLDKKLFIPGFKSLEYTVAPDDTLGKIAECFSSHVELIQIVNGLEGTAITGGDKLTIIVD